VSALSSLLPFSLDEVPHLGSCVVALSQFAISHHPGFKFLNPSLASSSTDTLEKHPWFWSTQFTANWQHLVYVPYGTLCVFVGSRPILGRACVYL
jgi:hypothetical protein